MTVRLAPGPAASLAAYAAAVGVDEARAAGFLLADALYVRARWSGEVAAEPPPRSIAAAPAVSPVDAAVLPELPPPHEPPPVDHAGVLADRIVRGCAEAWQAAGLPVRGLVQARVVIYRLAMSPGRAPDPGLVVPAAVRAARAAAERVGEERARGASDPYRFVPSLATWVERRSWEDQEAPPERVKPQKPVGRSVALTREESEAVRNGAKLDDVLARRKP